MILRTGIDLIEISRIEEAIARHGQRYLDRIYTAEERKQLGRNVQSLAGRFAAKEAAAKALGSGIGAVSWQDIEILGDEENAPVLTLRGDAAHRAQQLGLESWSVSISHSLSHAVAVVVATGS